MTALATVALCGALALDQFQFLFDSVDPFLNFAAIRFELRFTFTPAHTDTTFLPRQVAPVAREAWEQMLKLGQFNLELSFARAGALGENIENQSGAIENFTFEHLFQISALGWGKLVVENDRVDIVMLTPFGEFGGFARTDKSGCDRGFNFLTAGADDLATGGGGEFSEFFE